MTVQQLPICNTHTQRHRSCKSIDTDGDGRTEPGDTYLSRFADIYYNVSVQPVVLNPLLGRYLNACNGIDNHNMMRQSDLSLEKYWLTHSGYFILVTTMYWVWLLQVGSYYAVMVLQRENWTGNFRHWGKTTGRFMTDSIISLQINLVVHP